jgi:hypothetical protein
MRFSSSIRGFRLFHFILCMLPCTEPVLAGVRDADQIKEAKLTSWSSAFPDATPPPGLTLYRANDTVTWKLSPHQLQLANSADSNVPGMVRRPGAFVLAPGIWKNVTFTVEARSLSPEENPSRDICLIFGYQDATHFYYAHLSRNSDGAAHTVIMRVDGTTRQTIHKPITTGISAGPLTSSSGNAIWHTLRIVHRATGEITAYVDDMSHPVMTAQDQIYPAGRVGCGTFDDPALFRSMKVSGEQP